MCDAVRVATLQGDHELADLVRLYNRRHTAKRSRLCAVLAAHPVLRFVEALLRSPLLVPIWGCVVAGPRALASVARAH